MNKSYVSPTKLSCLALCCMISTLTLGFNSLILCVIAAAAFVFGIAIVSNLEKIANNHIRFIVYALIVSAIFSVLKIVFGYVGSIELIEIAGQLDYAYLASIVLSILPIYFMHKESSKDYYNKTIVTSGIFACSGVFVSVIIELLSKGTFFGTLIFDVDPSILGSPFVSFILIAVICVIGTAIENYLAEAKRAERMLVEKYKVIIRDHQLRRLAANKRGVNSDSSDDSVQNSTSEGGKV